MDEGRAGAAVPAPAPGSLEAKGSTILAELAAFLRQRKKLWLRPAQADDSPPPAAAGYMAAWRTAASRNIAIVAVFSVVVNLLMLTLPIYLFQISDRVLTSRSLDTLLMLSMLALVLRRRAVAARHPAPPGAGPARHQAGGYLGGPVLASIVNNARAGEGGNVQALRSLQQVRGFISSPSMLLLIDGPLAPIYFAVIFLIHPHLGFITVACGCPVGRDCRPEPARDGGAARPGRRACRTGRCGGRIAGAQRAGDQRHGDAEREHPPLGRASRRAR